MDDLLKPWQAFTRFLNDGRICISNSSAEGKLPRQHAPAQIWLFCGSRR
jgi:transposase